ncbi:antA/AntB antirepressor family protein, partial [Elizabethkingia miricola]
MTLELIKTENGKTAVQCSLLYNALGLAPQHYARWVGRNITRNPFAEIDKDFIPMKWDELHGNTPPMGEQNQSPKREFILTLEFAKKLAMLSRTEKGEEIRNYFLACEKAVQENTNALNTELLHELETFREIE